MRPAEDRDVLTFEGTVLSESRGGFYRCECTLGSLRREVLAKLCGKMIQGRIRLVPGDRVRVECGPYSLDRGRIVWRHRQ